MNEARNVIPLIVAAIAAVERCDRSEIEYSLFEYIDTEALRTLVKSDTTAWELTFEVPDHTVLVSGQGAIEVDGRMVTRFRDPATEDPA